MFGDINSLPQAQIPQEWIQPEEPQEVQEERAVEQQIAPQQQQAHQESDAAKNLRNLRELKERAERERDEALRIAQDLQNRFKQQSPQEQEDEAIALAETDLVEGKHLSKVDKKIKRLEQELKNYQQRSVEMEIESRLKSNYSDFDKVVSKSNVEALKNSYPEIAQALNASPDLYSKAVSAYTLIKKLGIHQEDLYESDRLTAQKNAAKPRPLASVAPQQGDSPISRANAFANGLTDELRAQLRREMESARKAL